jgi:hypothetical protein
MGWAWFAVFGTITAAVFAWAIAEIFRSRIAWTAGAVLSTLHSVAASGTFYAWSHDVAREMTRRQTEAQTGIDFSGGIYFNYAVLAVWLSDAASWWLSPRWREHRSWRVSAAIHGFLFFMIVNGAVIFADGFARVAGTLCVTAVVLARASRARRLEKP